jgi:dolichol-phosphate mannosyltransferase
MKTLVIIPTYNEIENLPSLLRGIFMYAPETDVLVVDDNSPDGTGQLIQSMSEQDRRIHIIRRPGKLGLGTAYIAGFKYAIAKQYDAAFEMDADFSHDPRHLPAFLSAIKSADLVIGSRYIPGGDTPNWSFVRRLISGSGNIFARFVLRVPVQDCTGGFRCYRRYVLESIDLDSVRSRGYAFQVEMTYRVLNKGFTVVETPIIFVDRRLGQSKMSRAIVLEAFIYVLKTRFSPLFMQNKRSGRVYVHQILPPFDVAIQPTQGDYSSGLVEDEQEVNLVRPNLRNSWRQTL